MINTKILYSGKIMVRIKLQLYWCTICSAALSLSVADILLCNFMLYNCSDVLSQAIVTVFSFLSRPASLLWGR